MANAIANSFSHSIQGILTTFWENATDTKFRQRDSPITPFGFLQSILIAHSDFDNPSLEQYCEKFEEITGKRVSKVAFHKRINPATNELMLRLLNHIIKLTAANQGSIPKLVEYFSDVNLLDSTQIELPNDLQKVYKGSSGKASKAGMKIQHLFSLRNGAAMDYHKGPAAVPDQNYGPKIINLLKEKSLTLFDLGYVTPDFLGLLTSQSLFYLCRFPYYQWNVFAPETDSELDLLEILTTNPDKIVEINVLLTNKRLPARLVAYPLAKEVYEKRQQEYIKRAKKEGRTPLQRNINFLRWSIYITNTPPELIATRDIWLVYKLRWLIELLFKTFKSNFHIDQIHGETENRINFEILAKLCYIALSNFILQEAKELMEEEIELSEFKSTVLVKTFIPKIIVNANKPKAVKKKF